MQQHAEPITLFKKGDPIFPKRVWGRYRRLKWVSMIVLLAIYYLAPFLRWDRGPHVPDQAILIDMPARRAYFFMIEIWPQDVWLLTGILVLAAIGLFFVTSMLGRVWCGYACPQTVWTDLFVWVERLVQGDRNKRMKLANASWSFEKLWKLGLTHFIWLIIGLLTGGAWVLYFNDAPTLMEQVVNLDVPWTTLSWMLGLTFATYFMAGFARENVCTYYCPYSRFQSAMFDADTLIIGYDEARGEPRGSHKKGESWEGRGHCIDCHQCVEVCPMGIDIREGLQMQCIACGLCVDACNNIMDKVHLPRGLIRYDTTNNQITRAKGKIAETLHIWRPRTLYYALILMLVGGVMLYGLLSRSDHEIHALHDRNPLFVQLSDGSIRNGYDIKILNKTHDDQLYTVSVRGLAGASLRLQTPSRDEEGGVGVLANAVGHSRIFVTAPPQPENRSDVTFVLQNQEGQQLATVDSIFVSGNR